MAVYLITYDLNKETTRPPLLKDIKDTYGTWAQLSESSYAVETADSPETIYNTLEKHIDSNDDLLIIRLSEPYFGQSEKTVIDWLDRRLTK